MAFTILGIDPGSEQTGYALVDIEPEVPEIITHGKDTNLWVLERLMQDTWHPLVVVVEYPVPRGQPMYYQLVDTIFWIGRFIQALPFRQKYVLMDRKDVKMTLCGFTKAKDSNIRTAIMNLYPPTGGGPRPQIGTAKRPGPLHGLKGDTWSALALCITHKKLMEVLN